jgi:hypothetical protein
MLLNLVSLRPEIQVRASNLRAMNTMVRQQATSSNRYCPKAIPTRLGYGNGIDQHHRQEDLKQAKIPMMMSNDKSQIQDPVTMRKLKPRRIVFLSATLIYCIHRMRSKM